MQTTYLDRFLTNTIFLSHLQLHKNVGFCRSLVALRLSVTCLSHRQATPSQSLFFAGVVGNYAFLRDLTTAICATPYN